ncbi:MAG: carboxypeptidase-like regulatory domain-containing protein, partial [Bacteroidales bacterium]|nr:carboxypeptidase-like regulatory domain-containing protein [Bacteroidales bacterium]
MLAQLTLPLKDFFRIFIGLCFLLTIQLVAYAQSNPALAQVYGKITDENANPIPFVNVVLLNEPGGSVSDENGNYVLKIPADKLVTIQFSFVGFQTEQVKVQLRTNQERNLNITLFIATKQLADVVVEDKEIRKSTLTRIDPQSAQVIPGVSGGIESLIKTLPGVSSNNELSSQYSVRGGSFDENLIYVNGIEVYRPLLTRSGEQEGLSFVNSDLVSSILFSAGGFEAKYGDKMASVLDIKYRKPTSFKGSAKISMLEAGLHFEDALFKNKLTYLVGFRQKSNQYLLSSLDTKGEYQPSFTDFQSLISYQPNEKWQFSLLGNYSRNRYKLVPQTRETAFGHIKEAYQLKIYFDGQEVDQFNTWFGGFTTSYSPTKNLNLKLIASLFQSIEEENYDIQGQYWIGQLETDLGQEDFGEVIETQGVGTYLNHARNHLNAKVWNIEHQGIFEHNQGLLQWGVKLQNELIRDEVNQWVMIDSAGFSKPYPRDSLGYKDPLAQTFFPFVLNDTLFASHELQSTRISGFIQNSWELNAGN